MSEFGAPIRLTGAAPEGKAGGAALESAFLMFVNVGTASTSASVSIYAGTSTNGTLVAVVDASNSSARAFQYMLRLRGGVYAVLTPAATGADVTLTVA